MVQRAVSKTAMSKPAKCRNRKKQQPTQLQLLPILLAFLVGWALPTMLQMGVSIHDSTDNDPAGMLSSSSTKEENNKDEEPFVNDLLKRLNYKTSVNDIRNRAGINDMFNPDEEAILFDGTKRTHPTSRVVIDVGAYDGMDISLPAYRQGYTVVAFELSPQNIDLILNKWKAHGLELGVDYEIVEGPFPLDRAPLVGHVGPNDPPKIYLVKAGASNVTELVRMAGSSTTSSIAQSTTQQQTPLGSQATLWTTRIDDIIDPATCNMFLLKTDAEGHDGRAIEGASQSLAHHNVYSIMLEFRPASMREQGTDPVRFLRFLWDNDMGCYDMNTHPGYEPTKGFRGGLGRPSDLAGFVAYLESISRNRAGPAGDMLGGWEDLFCTQRRLV